MALAVWRVEDLSAPSNDEAFEESRPDPSPVAADDIRTLFFGDSKGDTMPADDEVWVRVDLAGPKGSGVEVVVL